MSKINRGSEWSKWDLHMHTPLSIKQQYGNSEVGWEKFISALENLPTEVKVIGITDYYFIDGYEKVMQFKKNGRLTNIQKIFPVLEFRIDTFGTASENDIQKINLHVLFDINENDLEREIQKVKNEFIGQIPITKLEKHSTKMLTIDNLTIEGNNNLDNGFANLIPSTDVVFNKIKSDTWKDKTILFLGYKEWSNLEKNQQLRPFKEDLYSKIDAFFSNGFETNEKNQKWLNQYGNKRLLHSLDIHGFDLLDTYEFDKDENKKTISKYNCNTWIKARPTFEGLKQIIYEPIERVRIQKEKPESEKLENLMIEKVSFTSSNEKFTPEPIYFNKNLNVIIGGKSSGKSIILYEIAKTLYANTNDEVLRFKDIEDNNHLKDLYNLSENDNVYNFSVDLYSKSSQNKKDRESQSSILPSIKYIPQNHLSNLVDRSRKNGATLKKMIRDLILEDDTYKLKYGDFVAKAKKHDEQRNQDIDFYFSLKEELEKKDKELLTKGDTKALSEGIIFNKQKIKELNKDFSPEDLAKYNDLTQRLSVINIKENQIQTDFEKLDNFQTDLKRFLVEFSNKKRIVLDVIQTESIKTEFILKLQFLDQAINNVVEISNQFVKDESNKFIENSIFALESTKVKIEKEKTESDLKPFNERLENQKQVTALQKSISEDEAKIVSIEQFKKEIETTKNAILIHRQKIFNDFKFNFDLYEKIIKDLGSRISEVQSEIDKIEILPSVKYNFPKFRRLADEIFDRRGFNNQGFEYLYQYWDTNPKSALSDLDYEEIEKSLNEIFEKIEKKQLIPKGGNSEKDAIKKIFTDFFFDHWDVKSQGDDIHKMSTGKASFVLLKLIIKLSIENGPILIDQPEDNLDNRSVSKELVDFLKNKKTERQIILVTHNPNIVVNADAENIIVANQKGQNDIESTSYFKFDYINGALEDTFPRNDSADLLKSMGIREHIADIVEGGKEAFKKREEKYGF